MRKLLYFIFFILPGAMQAQNVGIGTNSPKAGFHVADGSVLFSSPTPLPALITDSPAEGATTGMMFFSNKAAFRLGSETGTGWSGQNIGAYSASFGRDNEVRATGGFSAGLENLISSTGNFASSFGAYNFNSGIGSVTLGNFNVNDGSYSTAIGYFLTNSSYASTVLGRYNVSAGIPDTDVATDPLLVVGNGTADNARSNAMVILKNGNIGVGVNHPTVPFELSDAQSSNTLLVNNKKTTGSASAIMATTTTNSSASYAVLGIAYEAGGGIIPGYVVRPNAIFGIGQGNNNGVSGISYSGVGVTASSTTGIALQASGKIQMSNNGEGVGKLLVSDANGNATWQNPIKLTMDNPSATGLASIEWRTNNIYRGGFGYDGSAGRFFFYDGESSTNTLFINNGRIGIQRDATTNALEVNGNASKSSAGSWVGNSDARLKKDIRPIQSALDKLLQLNGITYQWNDNKTGNTRPEGIQMGFTAQNIQQVFPENVSTDAQGYLQTAYGTYDALLVEAIRELTKKVELLEQKLASIQNK